MDADKEISELKEELRDLKSEIQIAKGTIKSTLTIISVIIFMFFGITYNNLDGIVGKVVDEEIKDGAITKAISRIDKESEDSIAKINYRIKEIETKSNEAANKIDGASDRILNSIPKILGTISKLDSYKATASSKVDDIEKLRIKAEDIIPSLEHISVSGTAEHGDFVEVPLGSVSDWSILITPMYIGPSGEGIDNNETVLLSADYKARIENANGWRIVAISRYKFGASSKEYASKVNYLLIPKGAL